MKLIFKTSSEKNKEEQEKEKCLQEDYLNFLVLNINSFMGGVTDIWSKAKDGELNNQKK